MSAGKQVSTQLDVLYKSYEKKNGKVTNSEENKKMYEYLQKIDEFKKLNEERMEISSKLWSLKPKQTGAGMVWVSIKK